ncbi:GNAT family N-acetyltransferase [Kribbella sp. NPDC003557]|uniref:GNAT family N-acetyltransferase n=1 Tax=Kribbella sp. NPDC003557 TaxID=3154449 RepID=UPI0033BDCE07
MTEIRSLVRADADEVDAVRRIYLDSFPERQRERFDDLIGAIRAGDVDGWVQVDGETPVGMAIALRFASVDWYFLEYFAVDGSVRGKGYGTALLASLVEQAGVRRMIFEVEDPNDTTDPDEMAIRRRRIVFYQRLGARLIDGVDYVVPDVTGTGTEPLRLMWFDADGQNLDRATLETLVRALYVEGYGLPPSHTLLAAAVKSLE